MERVFEKIGSGVFFRRCSDTLSMWSLQAERAPQDNVEYLAM
jgi:hypothetical protein